MTLRVLILHNAVAVDAPAAEADVLVQVEVVEQACLALAHRTERLGCTLDLAKVAVGIAQWKPDVVFNLVESLDGSDRLASLVPALLAAQNVPFTGSSQTVLDLTNNKLLAKRQLQAANLATALWATLGGESTSCFVPGQYILKAIWEHASVGIDDSAIVHVQTLDALRHLLKEKAFRFPNGLFAEQFIKGREFNLSVLAGPTGPQVLPPAEIDFSKFPPHKPRIVGYDAKWTDGSFEFVHTPRRFEFDASDRPLLRHLEYLAKVCWQAFDLRGYARVDFRVDEAGQPWILEINTNPCLSPDAGFAAALAQAGIDFPTAVQRILEDALLGQCAPPSVGEASRPTLTDYDFRSEVRPSDALAVRRIIAATEKFRPAEVDVAVELVEERLAKGAASGYEFVFADDGEQVVGYTCFGRIEVTVASFDLYWIAVDPHVQSRGLGKALLLKSEEAIRAAGGLRVYIETSGRPDYWTTRSFYEACGYRIEARVADFYAPGDDKVLYVKALR
jgi:D-alanine-D-alanine ligase